MKKITLFLLSTCMFAGIKSMDSGMDVEHDASKIALPVQQNHTSSKEKRVKNKHNRDAALLAALEKNNELLEQHNGLLRLSVITPYLIFRYNNHHDTLMSGKVKEPESQYNAMRRIEGEFDTILKSLHYPKDGL